MIQFNHVNKVYDNGSLALDDVTIHIEKGEFVLICGPSGAGKSTFIKLLSHEVVPDSGTVIVNDMEVSHLKKRKFRIYDVVWALCSKTSVFCQTKR